MFCNSFTGRVSASHIWPGVQIGKENLVRMDILDSHLSTLLWESHF